MIYSRLLPFALVGIILFMRCASSDAALLTEDDASALASTYIEAEFDERHIAYQLALIQLQFIQVLDGELTKARPSSVMTSASPAWKAARTEFLARISPPLVSMFSKDRMSAAYRTSFASSLSSEEAATLLSLLSSPEGRMYFHAKRLQGRQKAIESYVLATATSRSNLPELIPAQTVQADMEQLSRESKEFGKIDKEVTDRLKALAEVVAWKKLQRLTTTAALEAMKRLSEDGGLDDVKGSAHQVVKKAVNDFKASQETQKQ
jgi:hypothetical protein